MTRIIHITNTVAVIITILYYGSEVINGLIEQFFLGVLQILLALIMNFKYGNNKHSEFKKLLKYYWSFVFIAFLNIALLFCIERNDVKTYGIITICVIPMLIACYFVYVTSCINYKINKSIL